jgi:hypothetical protein
MYSLDWLDRGVVAMNKKGGGPKMLRPKSCPRCKTGDIGVDKDHHGWYEYCIQCGYMRDLVGVVELEPEPSHQAGEARPKVKARSREKPKYA